MRYNIFGYLIGEGFSNVFKNKKSTGASLMIMCATMIIFGVFLILGENINHFVKDVEDSQGIQVFAKDEATDEQVKALGEQISKIEGVNKTQFKSKEDALNQMKENLGEENESLLEGYEGENNIFTASYVVTLTDLNLNQQVQDEIMKLDNVKKIASSNQTVSTLIDLSNGIKIVTGVILILLIISNTIKLTVHARRKEISIMKYVGATNGFIRWPFIVEGMIIGIISSLISILLVGVAYNFIAEQMVNASFMKIMGVSLVSFGDMFNSIIVVYMLLGIGIGALGSIISMRKYLKV